jgi:hypothetical protein
MSVWFLEFLLLLSCTPRLWSGGFSDAPQFATATEPISIATGDFNGDGKLDVVVPAIGSNVVSVLLANGDGTFQPRRDFATHSEPVSIAVADFNRDGKLDLAVGCSFQGYLSILLGNGDGTFQPKMDLVFGGNVESIAAGDFNGDGIPDIIGTNVDFPLQTLGLLLGNGDGTFQPAIKISVGASPGVIAVADMNGDGKLDVVSSGAHRRVSGVSVILGHGDGTFGTPAIYPADSNVTQVVVADVNNDGKPDVITSTGSGNTNASSIAVFLGNGDGSLQLRKNYMTGSDATSLVAADLNGDGKVDIAVSDYNDNAVSVLLGIGDGTFPSHVDYGAGNGPDGIVAGNFNSDKKLDLVVANSLGNTASALIGNGDGTFQARHDYTCGTYPKNVAAGDLNGDGLPDLVTVNEEDATISVLLAIGNGTFQPHVDYATAPIPQWVALGDVNGDGKLDAVVPGNPDSNDMGTISVLLGNGDGTFQGHVEYSAGLLPDFVILGDVNGDGHLDAAVINGSFDTNGTISILLGNGDGSFQAPVAYRVGVDPVQAAFGDFNRDGHLDLVLNSYDEFGSENGTVVLLGNGDGTFQPKVDYAITTGSNTVAIGDVNGDGLLDVVAGDSSASMISVLLGKGDGTFQSATNYPTAATPVAVTLADFNGDGKLDLAAVNWFTFNISVLYGNGDGSFQPHLDYSARTYPLGLAFADFNGDGALDLVTANSGAAFGNTVSVLLNAGGTIIQAKSTPNPSKAGQSVTFSAIVRSSLAGGKFPSGTITLKDGTSVLSIVTLKQGRAQFSTSSLSVGTHTITSSYSGDANYNPQTGPTITQVVSP